MNNDIFRTPIFIIFILFTHLASAQNNLSFLVRINDSAGHGVGNIPILLIKGSQVHYRLTDSSGKANFTQLDSGTYRLLVQTIGYQKVDSVFPIRENGSMVISLVPVSHTLEAVEIQAFKAGIEARNGIFTVSIDSTALPGKNVYDLLSQIPMIQEENQALTVLNKLIIVFMNGKRLFIDGAELMQFLKGIPAQKIQKIEIIPFPGVKYNVPDNTAVVNIQTVKKQFPYTSLDASLSDEKGMGNTLDGAILMAHQGNHLSYAVNLQGYFTRVVDLYESDLTIPGKMVSHNQYRTITYNDPVTNFYITLEDKINRKNSLSFSTFGFQNNGNPGFKNNCTYAKSSSIVYTGSGAFTSSDSAFTNFYYRNRLITNVLSYIYRIDSLHDDRIQVDLSYIYDADHVSNHYAFYHASSASGNDYADFLYNDYPKQDHSIYGSLLLSKTMANAIQLSAALNFTDNQLSGHKISLGGNNMIDSAQTYDFRQHQRIYAVKLGLNNENDDQNHRLNYDLGVRLYFTKENSYQNNLPFYFRKYVNLIPSIHLSYNTDKVNIDYNLQSGNVYPNFWNVNPDVEYYNQKLITENNVYVKPFAYYQNFLTITYHQKHIVSFYDNYMPHAFTGDEGFIFIDSSGNIYFTQKNIAFNHLFSIYYQTSFHLYQNHVQLNPLILFRYQSVKAPDSLGGWLNQGPSVQIGCQAHLILSSRKAIYADFNGNFVTGRIDDFYRIKRPYTSISIDFIKKFRQFDVRLYVNDLTRYRFHQKREYISAYPYDYQEIQYHDSRVFGISMNWHIGNQHIQVEPSKPEEVNDVENRL